MNENNFFHFIKQIIILSRILDDDYKNKTN